MVERISGGPGVSLTPRQWTEVEAHLAAVQGTLQWHGGLPVLLHERCWLRLSCLPLANLLLRLPPDTSRDAPELVRYRQLLASGHPSWQAQQLCWDDFGAQACRAALRRFWEVQEHGNHGWTLERYVDLVDTYRHQFQDDRPRALPLLVMARFDGRNRREPHQLHWLRLNSSEPDRSMRHTCP